MKRIQKFAAINVLVALMGASIPAVAAQDGYDGHNRGGMQYQTVDHRGDRDWNDNRNRDFRGDDRGDRDRRSYDRRDYDRGYQGGPVYQSAPVYVGPSYEGGYYRDSNHTGRTVAIVGGSAAAGALIGAAAGHGQGAVVGALIGGVAGAAVSAAANHHHRY